MRYILTSLAFMLWYLVSCSEPIDLNYSAEYFKLLDEAAVEAKGGYYVLEEELNGEEETTEKVVYPKMTYFQVTKWNESSYGEYKVTQNMKVSPGSKKITIETIQESASCLSGYQHQGEVIKKINTTSTQKFKRSSSKDLQNVEDSSKSYDKASFLSIFVNSVSIESGSGYNYDFKSPVPFLIRNDLDKSVYKKRLKKPLSFSYEYTSDNNPIDKSGSATTTISLESSNSKEIQIKVETTLNSTGNAKLDADRIGNFPFPKSVIYTVNLKNKKILEYNAATDILVSKFKINESSRYTQGNVAPTTVETSLCKYKQGEDVEDFECR